MSARQAQRYIVRGRVQGVGFRYYVERAAISLDCSGYVRNRPDGTVEVLAMGTPAQLEELDSRLQLGPRLSRVESVEASEAAAEVIEGFEVRY